MTRLICIANIAFSPLCPIDVATPKKTTKYTINLRKEKEREKKCINYIYVMSMLNARYTQVTA